MATIKDVARMTGLSISTISKYMNGGNVLEENRVKIDEAIRSLGYRVNQAARSLKTNKTRTVGVLLPSLDVSFFANIVTDVEMRLMREGYNTIVCSFNNDPVQEIKKLQFLLEKNVDGILYVAESVTAEEIMSLREIRNHEIPLVLLDRHIQGLQLDHVLVDSASVCRAAVEQFIFSGHKKIGLIMGPNTLSTAQERLQGYTEALRAHNLPLNPEWIKVGDYTLESGYRLFGDLVDMDDTPTAILGTNYEMTMGAITAARERNLEIPGDVSFIGYDEPQLTRIFNPPITIVLQPTERMAEEVTKFLLRRMRGDYEGFPEIVRLRGRLLLYDSVRRV